MHSLLKRSVYKPLRGAGLGPLPAQLLVFVSSGLMHEYTFSLHNAAAYRPGAVTLFFLLMFTYMLLEAAASAAMPRTLSRVTMSLPTVLVTNVLVLLTLPCVPIFMESWLKSGMIPSLGALLPLVRCG